MSAALAGTVAHAMPCGVLGDPGTRLLAGPPGHAGSEVLFDHLARLGRLELSEVEPSALRSSITASGLEGRGGGQFPIAKKLDLAASSGGEPLVVVNASEGEPASRKDRTLLFARPHLVLDGAMVAAHAVGAREVVVYLHRSRRSETEALERALEERHNDAAEVRLIDAPERYVSGESSAVVSYLEGTGALPRRRRLPVAAAGVRGRPTVVSNAETVANLALIARLGATWFRAAGDASAGSSLLTLSGAVEAPGTVVELVGPCTMGAVLSAYGGVAAPPSAVLVGGYEGTWVDGAAAFDAPLSRGAMHALGAPLGCGLLAVLGHDACGLRTSARLVRWLASQSAGQCGPCVIGLPEIADSLDEVGTGTAIRRDVRRLRMLTASVAGRGDCGHPTGVATLVDSTLVAFARDLGAHVRGRPCTRPPARFPLPANPTEPR